MKWNVKGLWYFQMKFTKTHEWFLQDRKKEGIVGISKHARAEIGELAYIEFPKIGAFVKAGDDACVIESTKAAVVVHSPVSGKIVAINREAMGKIALVNQDPEGAGWLYRIEFTEPRELDVLLSRLDYEHLLRGDALTK
jgi:glycine cleavage system H protein